MSNPNTDGQQNPWQSQNQQPYPTQPISTSKEQHGGSHAAQMPLGQQFDQQQQAQQMSQQSQQQGAVMPYAQPQQQMTQHGASQNGMMPYGMGNAHLLGKLRNSWACIGLCIITLGFYSFYWTYSVYNEMKRHRGAGTGGGVAVLLMFVPFATYFMTPSEVSNLYTSRGRVSPVSGATGLWCFLPFLGALVWFLQVNGALNDYWTSMGAGRDQIASQQRPVGA